MSRSTERKIQMEKSMRELLERSFQGKRVIAYIESLEQDNMLLTKERDALAKESEMKCELNQQLNKQVDKLCKRQADCGFCHGKTKSSEKCTDLRVLSPTAYQMQNTTKCSVNQRK